jgi:hypothetical protein
MLDGLVHDLLEIASCSLIVYGLGFVLALGLGTPPARESQLLLTNALQK